jgi:antitoxin component YwqK of YwqJK toxin-antitoxin module
MLFLSCSDSNIYYDADWKNTTKENAVYYRKSYREAKGIWPINDYYISGEKQFKGQAIDSIATILEGDATWYFKTGKVQSKLRFKNGEIIGEYIVKNNAIGSEKTGWNEEDLVYSELYNAANVANASDGRSTNTYEHYYVNTSLIASQHTSNVGYDNKYSFTLYFNKKGGTIARLNYNEKSDKWSGKEVVFYELEQRGKNDYNSIKEIHTYNEGIITHTDYYNKQEELVAQITLKDNKAFNGTILQDICKFQKIKHFKNASLEKEITLNKGKQIAEITFVNNLPYIGVLYSCSGFITYANGKKQGEAIQYFDDEGDIESKFNYNNGYKHGNYVIYESQAVVLEKGTYKNGVQTNTVIYYHNGNLSVDERENHYYLEAKIKSKKNNPFITKLLQFNTEDNELLNTFEFEKNNTDQFNYLNNGYHAVYLDDINNDGFNDLRINYNQYYSDLATNTYYLFNDETNKYEHISELDEAKTVKINSSKKTITVSFGDDFEDRETRITYSFKNRKLIKNLELEVFYNQETDEITTTQVYPVQVDKYPLLANNLPYLTFVQQHSKQPVINTQQTITLKKEPFTITLPGLSNGNPAFEVKIIASYNESIFEEVPVSEINRSILSNSNTFAVGINSSVLIIDDSGHNMLYYDINKEGNLKPIKKINDQLSVFQAEINKMHNGDREMTISEIDKPIYMVIYINKNDNLKIENNEIYYLTLLFK